MVGAHREVDRGAGVLREACARGARSQIIGEDGGAIYERVDSCYIDCVAAVVFGRCPARSLV